MFSNNEVIVHCLIKHSSCMRHAMYLCDAFLFIKNIIPNISISLKIALKVSQYFHRSFSAPTLLIIEENYFLYAVLIHPVITTMCLSLLVFIKNFNRRFICMQVTTLQYF